MDANECLPLFCCGTPPQGGNFHIMGNSTCKLTILESMVRNFKKGFFWGSGFPHSSVGKESACNAGNPGSIPGLGRSPREGKGYPLQYSGLENSMDCSPWGCNESDMAEQLSVSLWPCPIYLYNLKMKNYL